MMKTVEVDGRKMTLTSMFPAIVMEGNGKERSYRTMYKDQGGELWCFWHGAYMKAEKIDGSKLPYGRRVKEAYTIVSED